MSLNTTAPPDGGLLGAGPPPNFILFGPRANCTLDLCPVEWSVYGYRPSLAANFSFIALYVLAACVHAYLGVRWKSWWFMWCMIAGCVVCTIGYIGRIVLYYNPWSFPGFMIQIICVGTGPVYFCAAIYVVLSKVVMFLSPIHSRVRPELYYWVFIPCDIVALVLQAVGGALSTNSSGSSQVGVDLGLAGLAFQVATMTAFSVCLADYMWRYLRSPAAQVLDGPRALLGRRLAVFLAGLGLATLLILVRSAYRVEELSKGYGGPSIRNEGLFIWLEGVLIVVATYALCIGHPGMLFHGLNPTAIHTDSSGDKIPMNPVAARRRSSPI